MRPDPNNPAADFDVQWFFVPEDRAALGFPTVFTSSTWDPVRFLESIGELRDTREWSRGRPPLVQPLQEPPNVCGSLDKWVDGWPAGTPGLILDPVSGVPICCGQVAVPYAVRSVWSAAQRETTGAAGQVEGGASTLSLRRLDVVGTAWGAAHVAGYIKPAAAIQVEACDANARMPKPFAVQYVYAADFNARYVKPNAIAYVEGARCFQPIIKPHAVISVWDGDADVSITYALDVVADVESVGSAPPRILRDAVAQVEGNLQPEQTGRMIASTVEKPHAGAALPALTRVAWVEGVHGVMAPPAAGKVAYVEAVASYDWVGRPGPAALVWLATGAPAKAAVEAVAVVEAVASTWSRRFVQVAGQVEGAAAVYSAAAKQPAGEVFGATSLSKVQGGGAIGEVYAAASTWSRRFVQVAGQVEAVSAVFTAIAKQPAGEVWGAKFLSTVQGGGAAGEVWRGASTWSRRFVQVAGQVEGCNGPPSIAFKVGAGQVEGAAGSPRQVQRQGIGVVWSLTQIFSKPV
jgi:hypothetical protein